MTPCAKYVPLWVYAEGIAKCSTYARDKQGHRFLGSHKFSVSDADNTKKHKINPHVTSW